MRRWATNILCLLSLLVFAASLVIEVRSYFVREILSIHSVHPTATEVPQPNGLTAYMVAWSRGTVGAWRLESEWPETRAAPSAYSYSREKPIDPLSTPDAYLGALNWRLAGCQLMYTVSENEWHRFSELRIILPLWLFLPFGIPPLLWLRRWRRSGGRGFEVKVASSTEKIGSQGSTCSPHAVTKATKAAAKD